MEPSRGETLKRVGRAPGKGSLILFTIAALLIFGLDQLSKEYVQSNFSLHESETLIPGLFNLTYITNTGVAFGLFSGEVTVWKQGVFLLVGLLAAAIIVYFFRQLASRGRGTVIALGMILGGAAGNSVDRVRLAKVIDFLDFYIGHHHWPAFNIADTAITCGVSYLMISIYRHKE